MNKQTSTYSKSTKSLIFIMLLVAIPTSILTFTFLFLNETYVQAEEPNSTAQIDPNMIVYWKELSNFQTNDFAIDPINSANIYAASDLPPGIVLSHDYGATWTAKLDGFNGDVVAVDPMSPNYVYLGVSAGIMFRSTDFGDNWERIDDDIADGEYLSELYVHPITPTLLFAGAYTSPEIYRSDDRGETWSKILLMPNPINRTVMQILSHPTIPNKMYALVKYEGIFVSEDTGLTWINTGVFADSMAIDSGNPNIMYRSNCTPYRSIDGGMTWSELDSPQPCYDEIHIDPQNSDIVYLTGQSRRVTRSLDAGQSWKVLGEEFYSLPNSSSFAIDPVDTSRLYVGPGVFVSSYLDNFLHLPTILR